MGGAVNSVIMAFVSVHKLVVVPAVEGVIGVVANVAAVHSETGIETILRTGVETIIVLVVEGRV